MPVEVAPVELRTLAWPVVGAAALICGAPGPEPHPVIRRNRPAPFGRRPAHASKAVQGSEAPARG